MNLPGAAETTGVADTGATHASLCHASCLAPFGGDSEALRVLRQASGDRPTPPWHAHALEDCVVEAMNASGAAFTGEDAVGRRCVFRNNGQLGFGASRAHRLLFADCLVENNSTKGYDRGFALGAKRTIRGMRFRVVILEDGM